MNAYDSHTWKQPVSKCRFSRVILIIHRQETVNSGVRAMVIAHRIFAFRKSFQPLCIFEKNFVQNWENIETSNLSTIIIIYYVLDQLQIQFYYNLIEFGIIILFVSSFFRFLYSEKIKILKKESLLKYTILVYSWFTEF